MLRIAYSSAEVVAFRSLGTRIGSSIWSCFFYLVFLFSSHCSILEVEQLAVQGCQTILWFNSVSEKTDFCVILIVNDVAICLLKMINIMFGFVRKEMNVSFSLPSFTFPEVTRSKRTKTEDCIFHNSYSINPFPFVPPNKQNSKLCL